MKKGVSTSSSGKRKLFLRGHVSQFTTRPNPNHGIQVQGTPPGHVAPRARLNHAPGAQVPPLDEADAGARLLEAARAGAHKRNERDDEEHQQEREQEQRAEEAAVLVEPHGGHDPTPKSFHTVSASLPPQHAPPASLPRHLPSAVSEGAPSPSPRPPRPPLISRLAAAHAIR
ncbi:hypothetical protein S40285_09857 [Stachybotrys chlorohalonatus IBT 40285]|uniref:Uncharacterized protein n=1 Tax=Stachybotrys chlorohalonatus (strain IBT 40285) TaxID=1283841 RepID=A0A084R2U9_STAC4|nr:hypothetical protein S40285_09857 [Stachybotrys chlorohalonata IBT 40285]